MHLNRTVPVLKFKPQMDDAGFVVLGKYQIIFTFGLLPLKTLKLT